MNKSVHLISLFLLFLLVSCDDPFIRGFDDDVLPKYTGDMNWEKVVDTAQFSHPQMEKPGTL